MSGQGILTLITVFVLSAFVGFEVISKVPSILHTPLMSGSNAIHGIVLVGALAIMGEASGTGQLVLGFIAVFLATLNIVGGFVVTDRMLEMFRAKQRPGPAGGTVAVAGGGGASSSDGAASPSEGRETTSAAGDSSRDAGTTGRE